MPEFSDHALKTNYTLFEDSLRAQALGLIFLKEKHFYYYFQFVN
jgi:hypothetical protein